MAWKQIGGGGSIIKWDHEGQVVEGVWAGTRDGKFGLLGDVKQADGKVVSVSMGAVLTDRLAGVEDGEMIRIVYMGQGKTKTGGKLNLFDVFVDQPEDEPVGKDIPF